MGQIHLVGDSRSLHLLANDRAPDLEISDAVPHPNSNDTAALLYRVLGPLFGAQAPILLHFLQSVQV